MAQFAAIIAEKLVAPAFSELVSCNAPELEELPRLGDSMFLNNLFVTTAEDRARPAIIIFIRHLAVAVDQYRGGRIALLACLAAQKNSGMAIGRYSESLSHFEHMLIRAQLAAQYSHVVVRIYDADAPVSPFRPRGSPEHRLNILANRFKHFHSDVIAGAEHPAPIWITNDGLRCRELDGNIFDLGFTEIVSLLQQLRSNAQFLAEEVYRLAQERQGGTNATTHHESG